MLAARVALSKAMPGLDPSLGSTRPRGGGGSGNQPSGGNDGYAKRLWTQFSSSSM
jgi:hypothetical protein